MDRKTSRTATSLVAGLALVLASLASALLLGPKRVPEAAPAAEASATPAQQEPVSDEDAIDAEREAYVASWAERIDAFNAGYPLEGYGRTFAEAAYDYGLDPRFSPAIARVESGSGQACAYPCNAWGWGTQSWGDWESAIYGHAAGLAQGYGPEPTYAIAQSYNEENPDEWLAQVSACMEQI